MPIVVTEPAPSTPFGWGHLVDLITNTPGPFLPPLSWDITMMDTDLSRTWGELTVAVEDPHVAAPFKFIPHLPGSIAMQNAFQQGADARLRARLLSGTEIAEEVVVPIKLDVLGWLNETATKTASGGALTPAQAAQLEETHSSTFPAVSLDALLLSELTNGPQGGVVAAQLALWIFGVIVRIANVPPELRPDTADGDYWVKSLAVVRIYRGSDLYKRVPVHTSSKLISFADEGLIVAVASITTLQWLVQLSIQVSFAEGVTGQVFLMRAP